MLNITKLPSFAPLGADDIARLAFQNAGAATLAGGIATFGQVFAQGEVPAGSGLMARIGGAIVPVQIDVKTTYPDGSARMAVLSVGRPDLAAGSAVDVVLALASEGGAPAVNMAMALDGHSFVVDMTLQGSVALHIDVLDALRDALADGTATFWQQGPLATQARVEVPLAGSQRLVFDVTTFQGGGLTVDALFNNDGAMGAQGGGVDYSLVVTMDGRQVAQETISQGQYQNWHEKFTSNGRDGGQGLGDPAGGWLNIQQDAKRLSELGVVADYDYATGVGDTLLAKYQTAQTAPGWGDPLASNAITQYLPTTGGRADIGITTQATTAWLITQDTRAASYSLAQAETAGAVPWNFWDAAHDTWLNTDNYPRIWTDGRGGTGRPGDPTSGGLTQQVVAGVGGWTADTAHQPDLSFVPYVLTGERWILDNLNAQAAFNVVTLWPAVREDGMDLIAQGNQVRGAAWGLRQVEEAAWASPDGSVEKAYFTSVADANWTWLVAQIPAWTEQQGEAHGWLPALYGGGAMPPWQQDFLASTAIAAASRGNADALTFLEWQSNFLIGRFTHAAEGFNPRDGVAYIVAVADPTTGLPYKTWAEIGEQEVANGWSNLSGWDQSQGYYGQLALATLAGIYQLTGSAEAAAAYRALAADPPPFTAAENYLRDPTFSLAPPPASESGGETTGAGDDTYRVNSLSTVVTEGLNQGNDTVLANISYTLGANLENLVLTGTAAVSGTGNALANRITGHAGANALDGGAGADTMVGGRGNDSYVVDSIADTVIELTSEGIDTVRASVNYTLAPNLETLVLTGTAGRVGIGNGTDNHISGNLAANLLSGDGGNDWVDGGGGGDQIFGGAGNDTLLGGKGNDWLDGSDGNDMVSGGAGTDRLAAGAGQDVFLFDATPMAGAADTIGDFLPGTDQIWFSLGAFDPAGRLELVAGSLASQTAHFVANTTGKATEPGLAQIVYDTVRGRLFWDADGRSGAAGILVATLEGAPQLTASDVSFTAPGSTPAAIASFGNGPDVARLGLSQDALPGQERYLVLLDGVQLGGKHVVYASRGAGEPGYLDIRGDFGEGRHDLVVRFLNDGFGGASGADRALYVESVSLNGFDTGLTAALLTRGDAHFLL